MGKVLPDPGLLRALKFWLPGGTGFRGTLKIGFIKFAELGAGSAAWLESSPTPASAPPSPSPTLWIPVVGLVLAPVGFQLPAGFHGHDRADPGDE